MPRATPDPTTSRRHILAALSGAAFAGGALVLAMPTDPPSGATTEHGDVLAGATPSLRALYEQWREAERVSGLTSGAAISVRRALVACWGNLPPKVSASDYWGHDPRYVDLARLCDESDDLSDIASAALEEVMDQPVASMADIGIKLVAVASIWAQMRMSADNDFHEIVTSDFLIEASAFLKPGDMAGRV